MQYSLRKLLAAVAIAFVFMAILMYITVNYRKQMAIRSSLQKMGAYSVQFGTGNTVHASFHDPIRSSNISKYSDFGCLDFKEAHVTDESLANLKGLKSVGLITFSLSDVRDDHLRHLRDVGKVRNLWLCHTGLTDACVEYLIDIPGLESVDVSKSQITQFGIQRLREARPSIVVRNQ